MRVIVDRFEGDFAVCEKEDRSMMDIEKKMMPITTKEGDVLNIINDRITLNLEETDKRKKEIEELTKDLWN